MLMWFSGVYCEPVSPQQDAAGRQSQRNAPLGSLITGDRVDYPSSADLKFNRERRKEYNEYIKVSLDVLL